MDINRVSSSCSDAQVRRIHASLLVIRNISRRLLLDDQIPRYVHKDLVDIENLADLSESLITHSDEEVMSLIDAKIKENYLSGL